MPLCSALEQRWWVHLCTLNSAWPELGTLASCPLSSTNLPFLLYSLSQWLVLCPLSCLNQDVTVHIISASPPFPLSHKPQHWSLSSTWAFLCIPRAAAMVRPYQPFPGLLQGPPCFNPRLPSLQFCICLLVLVLPEWSLQFVHLITGLLKILQWPSLKEYKP